MTKEELGKEVYKLSHLTGEFLLRSGKISNEYFDKYQFESYPALLKEIAREMANLIPANCQVLAALEMGGIPIATAIALETGLPIVYVRKKAKEYGTRRFSEGIEIANKQVVIIEDVVTSGGQIIMSANDLRNIGAKIDTTLCVIDREEGGSEKLMEAGLKLIPLFRMSELKQWALVDSNH
ncbi:MAG TPA: orotate phosphoribosyltransferase [Bacteroidota bacterium]|nr:orotate phosphoribosyltransferase [Candidatus Kapabacteria bacterium]HRS01475.1 orotate phosphoribosyltransferase [Bacteroidota bacterium]HRT67194.1 orotate phosphoribosyltransferase [Bacteroidota bacterium]